MFLWLINQWLLIMAQVYILFVFLPIILFLCHYLGVIKAGFAGDTIPKCIFLNLVGRPKHVRVMAGALEGDHFIGVLIICFFNLPKKTFLRSESRGTSWFIINKISNGTWYCD